MAGLIDLLRTPRSKIIVGATFAILGLAQVITGAVLAGDVYSWGICAFSMLTGLAGLGYGGYVLFKRGEVDTELAFAICISILLTNLQAVFVLGACTAPLAETYARDVLDIYRDLIEDMFSKQCSNCMKAEDAIEDQVLSASSQKFGGEIAYLMLSLFQVIVFAVGSIAAFDNHALGELDMVPNSCLTLKDNSDGPVTTDELGFDEL